MKQRILYFDWIKGLAIILVVMGHLYTFSETTSGNLINKLIGSFHMALFMYVSGFVAFAPDNLKRLNHKIVAKKCEVFGADVCCRLVVISVCIVHSCFRQCNTSFSKRHRLVWQLVLVPEGLNNILAVVYTCYV